MKAKPTKSTQTLKNNPVSNKDKSISITLKESLQLLEQRNAELAVISSVQEGLVAEMDMHGIYDLVSDKTRKLFDSQITVIATFDHESHKEHFNYVFEDEK